MATVKVHPVLKAFFCCNLIVAMYFMLHGNTTSVTHVINEAGGRSRGRSRVVSVRPVFKAAFPRCKALFDGDQDAQSSAVKFMASQRPTANRYPIVMSEDLSSCEYYRRKMKFFDGPPSEAEKRVPVAYSILFYMNLSQLERLLRAIYRPHNSYCLHIDRSASETMKRLVTNMADCFDNVFVASKLELVVYGGYSRLQADFNCFTDLLTRNKDWKYLINLSAQMYPLKTSQEISEILHIYNGANDIEGITSPHRLIPNRFQKSYYENKTSKRLVKTNKKKGDPPLGLTVVKGSAYGVFSRDFVTFVLKDKEVSAFLDWSRDVFSPDEYVWATLNHVKVNSRLKTPGGFPGDAEKKAWLATFAAWPPYQPCFGKNVRGVCVFGVRDLPALLDRKELFANKFFSDFEPLTLDCMDELLYNKSESSLPLNLQYYRNLPFVKEHL